jgi:methionine aminopeptidase
MRPLEDGDIVNLDISVYLHGYHGDLNETVLCGNVDEAGRNLVKGAWECLAKAIELVKPGTRFRDVGDIISAHAARGGLSVVRTYCGHGIGCAAAARACVLRVTHWLLCCAESCFTARPTFRTTAGTRLWASCARGWCSPLSP